MSSKTKEYVRQMPASWWLQHPAYFKFMVRELSSVFIAGYCVFLMVLMYRVQHGQDGNVLHTFLFETLYTPLSVALHVIALFFALFHTITFLNLTPRVIVVHRGDERVPDGVIAGVHYLMFVLATAGLILLAIVACSHGPIQ